jgi:hypothetical protein
MTFVAEYVSRLAIERAIPLGNIKERVPSTLSKSSGLAPRFSSTIRVSLNASSLVALP